MNDVLRECNDSCVNDVFRNCSYVRGEMMVVFLARNTTIAPFNTCSETMHHKGLLNVAKCSMLLVLSSYMKSITICHDCHLLIIVSIHVFLHLTMLLLVGFHDQQYLVISLQPLPNHSENSGGDTVEWLIVRML